ncbi:hypothetical protein Tco_0693796 [Tanacetum coccineum]
MAQMGFCDKHNMVAFLQKPSGSEEFHQIVDFLADSHIRYALTANPTIYVSLVEQFWQTATVETVNDGEQQITVTVDGHKFAITEASVRKTYANCRLDIQITDEELAKKVQEEEQTKVLEQQEQERANLEAALNLQKQFDEERKAADDIDWSKIIEQAQERQSGSMIRIGFRMELVQGATPICEGSCRLTSLESQEVERWGSLDCAIDISQEEFEIENSHVIVSNEGAKGDE